MNLVNIAHLIFFIIYLLFCVGFYLLSKFDKSYRKLFTASLILNIVVILLIIFSNLESDIHIFALLTVCAIAAIILLLVKLWKYGKK